MSADSDILFLAWLRRRPSAFASDDDLARAPAANLAALERRNLIVRVPASGREGLGGYVLTPAGRAHQEGD